MSLGKWLPGHMASICLTVVGAVTVLARIPTAAHARPACTPATPQLCQPLCQTLQLLPLSFGFNMHFLDCPSFYGLVVSLESYQTFPIISVAIPVWPLQNAFILNVTS